MQLVESFIVNKLQTQRLYTAVGCRREMRKSGKACIKHGNKSTKTGNVSPVLKVASPQRQKRQKKNS